MNSFCVRVCLGMGGKRGIRASQLWYSSRTTEDFVYKQPMVVAAVLLPTLAFAGGPILEVGGSCPGAIDVLYAGGTPGGTVAVLTGRGPGADVIPGGPCAGTPTDLAGLSFVTTLRADPSGALAVSPVVGGGVCGASVQFLDLETCLPSTRATIPGGDVELPPECTDYGTLDQSWRNVSATGPVYCDRDEIGLNYWYRFEGPAGTRMPETAPATYQCSTHAPGWLDGIHPREAGRSAELRTCWHWSADECQWESETTVTNCGDYFVYYLRELPFACNGVFCGE